MSSKALGSATAKYASSAMSQLGIPRPPCLAAHARPSHLGRGSSSGCDPVPFRGTRLRDRGRRGAPVLVAAGAHPSEVPLGFRPASSVRSSSRLASVLPRWRLAQGAGQMGFGLVKTGCRACRRGSMGSSVRSRLSTVRRAAGSGKAAPVVRRRENVRGRGESFIKRDTTW